MHVNLVYFRPDGERKDIPLHGSEVLIGRGEDCNLRIPLASVSRQHCRIIIGDDEVVIEDLGSANGTFVNNQKIGKQAVSAGDRMAVGQAAFVVQLDGKPKKVRAPHEMLNGSEGEAVQPTDMIAAGRKPAAKAPAKAAQPESAEIAAGSGASVLDDSSAEAVEVEAVEEEALVEVEEAAEEVEEVAEEVEEVAEVVEEAPAAEAPVVEPASDGEVVLDEEVGSSEEAAEVAIDLESVESSNDGAGSSSVEDILLELEAAEEEEAKKKR